jgi:hypothetical protein
MGYLTIIIMIFIHIRIQQNNRLPTVHVAFQNVQPTPDPNRPVFNVNRYFGLQWNGGGIGLPMIRLFNLATIRIQFLAKITGATHQGNCNHRQFKISGRAYRITGQYA